MLEYILHHPDCCHGNLTTNGRCSITEQEGYHTGASVIPSALSTYEFGCLTKQSTVLLNALKTRQATGE